MTAINCLNGNLHCVYTHSKPDGSIFYVGMGLPGRPYNTISRNDQWLDTAKCAGGFKAHIVEEFIPKDEAHELEELLIAELRERGANLCNLTNGGMGTTGYKPCKEAVRLRAEKMKGIKRSAEFGAAVSKGKKGKPNLASRKPIRCLDTGKEFTSITAAAKARDISLTALCNNLQGYSKTCGGYRYEYIQGDTNAD